jgi:hypothetical protein
VIGAIVGITVASGSVGSGGGAPAVWQVRDIEVELNPALPQTADGTFPPAPTAEVSRLNKCPEGTNAPMATQALADVEEEVAAAFGLQKYAAGRNVRITFTLDLVDDDVDKDHDGVIDDDELNVVNQNPERGVVARIVVNGRTMDERTLPGLRQGKGQSFEWDSTGFGKTQEEVTLVLEPAGGSEQKPHSRRFFVDNRPIV